MIRHVATLRFKPGTTAEQVESIRAGLLDLVAEIPELRTLTCGPDARLADGNAAFAIVADFDDAEGYAAYAAHPAHVRLIEERMREHLAGREAVQFETGGRDPVAQGV